MFLFELLSNVIISLSIVFLLIVFVSGLVLYFIFFDSISDPNAALWVLMIPLTLIYLLMRKNK